MIRSVSLLAYMATPPSPLAPAGTMAALATIVLVRSFSVETGGLLCPYGQTVRYTTPPVVFATTVKFSEYACRFAPGGVQELSSSGKSRSWPRLLSLSLLFTADTVISNAEILLHGRNYSLRSITCNVNQKIASGAEP